MITLEYANAPAEVARRNLARPGLDKITEVRVGPALESLAKLGRRRRPLRPGLHRRGQAQQSALSPLGGRLSRPGSVIIRDNVVRGGAVTDKSGHDPM